MESTTERIAVTRELVIDASPETVWEFLVDPEKIVRWKGVSARLEPHVGGAYRVEVLPTHTVAGEIVELVPEGSGTRLRFTHRDLPTSKEADSHAHGWDHYLPRLAAAASGSDPGRDPWLERSE